MGKLYRSGPMRVAALQYDISSDAEENLAYVLGQLELAAGRGIELVLLPEMWASSFPTSGADLIERVARDRESVATLCAKGAQLGICVGGSALWADGERVFNRLEFFAGGARIFHYDKVHLFTPTAEQETFVAGSLAPPVAALDRGESGSVCLSGAICYDLRFPEIFRVPFRSGVQILCVSAQWPTPRVAHWELLAMARAVENQCFLLASNRTGEAHIGRRQKQLVFPGHSLVISPYGEVLARGDNQPGLVEAQLPMDEARHFRVRVPVLKDERPELYRKWLRPLDPG